MTKKQSKLKKENKLTIPKPDAEIVKESMRWIRGNKGTELSKSHYTSPRISSEIPDCSMPMTFDHYNYCSLGCLYCFAYFFKSNNPSIKSVELKSVDIERKIAAIRGNPTTREDKLFYEHFYKRKFLLHWGGMADPFCQFEKANHVGYKLMRVLAEENYPTLFSFKGDGIFEDRYQRLFKKWAHQQNFAFQVSTITNSDELSKLVEVGVPPTSKRIEAIKMLSDMGYWTILRLRPFIIGISDVGLDELLERALAAGIRGISMEFFAMDGRANKGMKTRYAWLAKAIGVDNLWEYFKKLSPKERGGYMRLNRNVKEPHVRKVYEFCAKHNLVCGISDPDFKELNTSGSCCAMPDDFPDNRLLENWTCSQLTYHVKEARKAYHTTGERRVLTFAGVYGDESYFDEKGFANDHVGVIGRCYAERSNLTHRIMLQEKWNNLNSPANPRNYLHGKVMPFGTDDDGNLKYIYSPHEYEARWAADGVDLTR